MADQELFGLIEEELHRQRNGIELIASENFTSTEVMRAMGTVPTNKYAEGYPGKRYYGGCQIIDQIETLAIDRAKKLFGVEYANVQPHSGAQANAAVMLGCLQAGDTILGLDLSMGGHLTHGSTVNFSGKLYNEVHYTVRKEDGLVDYEMMHQQTTAHKPKLIICGASAYSRDWDYARVRAIADEVGALVLADISHPAGLIAAGRLASPFEHCHIVTTTTHKTLRGPRGGMILMGRDFENPWGLKSQKGEIRMMSHVLDMAVFPGTQGGPLEHIIAAKAVAFHEALQPEYAEYIDLVIENAKAMESELLERGYDLVSGGTDNHLLLIDLRNKGVSGKKIENALVKAEITINKNMVPYDDKSPFVTSGIRIGSPAITSRGMMPRHMPQIIEWMDQIIMNPEDKDLAQNIKSQINEYMQDFPLYPDLKY